MSRGPLPAQLCLLSSLPSRPRGDKVRFLGCVTSYSMATATLILEHAFPEGTNVRAVVDVRLVLESLKNDQTRVGEWVNVLGYVAAEPAGKPQGVDCEPMKVQVQALLLWSAGPLDIRRYEMAAAEEEADITQAATRRTPT